MALLVKKGQIDDLTISQVNENINLLGSLYKEGKEVLDINENTKMKALLSLITRALALQKMIHQKRMSNAFSITQGLIDALIPLAIARAQQEKASATFSVLLAEEGWNEDFGEGYQTILEAINRTANENQPLHWLIPTIYKGLSLLFATLVSDASGLALKIKDDSSNKPEAFKESIQSLCCKMGSCLIASSDLLPFLSRTVFEVEGDQASQNQQLALGATLMAMHTILFAAVGENTVRRPDPLLGGMKSSIHELIVEWKENIQGSQEIGVAIRQGDMALKANQAGSYFEAIKTGLKPLKLTPEKLQAESEALMSVILSLLAAYYRAGEGSQFVTVVHQAA